MTQIEKLMSALGCTEQEAVEIIEFDKAVDKGADPFPLSAEQKKTEKKMRQADRKKPTVYKLDNTNGKRSKKANEVKSGLIELLSVVVKEQPSCNSLEIINPEREFVFSWMGTKFKVVLSAPRS